MKRLAKSMIRKRGCISTILSWFSTSHGSEFFELTSLGQISRFGSDRWQRHVGGDRRVRRGGRCSTGSADSGHPAAGAARGSARSGQSGHPGAAGARRSHRAARRRRAPVGRPARARREGQRQPQGCGRETDRGHGGLLRGGRAQICRFRLYGRWRLLFRCAEIVVAPCGDRGGAAPPHPPRLPPRRPLPAGERLEVVVRSRPLERGGSNARCAGAAGTSPPAGAAGGGGDGPSGGGGGGVGAALAAAHPFGCGLERGSRLGQGRAPSRRPDRGGARLGRPGAAPAPGRPDPAAHGRPPGPLRPMAASGCWPSAEPGPRKRRASSRPATHACARSADSASCARDCTSVRPWSRPTISSRAGTGRGSRGSRRAARLSPAALNADHHQCPDISFNFVKPRVLEIGNTLRRALLVQPVANATVVLEYAQVPMGRELAVGAGLHNVWRRKGGDGTVRIRALVDGRRWASPRAATAPAGRSHVFPPPPSPAGRRRCGSKSPPSGPSRATSGSRPRRAASERTADAQAGGRRAGAGAGGAHRALDAGGGGPSGGRAGRGAIFPRGRDATGAGSSRSPRTCRPAGWGSRFRGPASTTSGTTTRSTRWS